MSDLRGMTAPEKVELGDTGKIVGAAVIAIAVCAGGAYFYIAGTGKAAPHQQVVASNGFSSPALPAATPAIVPQQPTVAPPPTPDSSAAQAVQSTPLQAAPVAAPSPPVKTARIHTPKYTTPPSQVAPMPDNNATPATPPSAPPASSLSEQPAPAVNTTQSVPSQETPAQNVPQQPAQNPDQPSNDQQNTTAPQQLQ
jgi:hypothetical protein